MLQGFLDCPPSRAGLDRKTELRIQLARRDVIVSVRLDPRRQAGHDWCSLTLGNDLPQQLELVIAVDDDRHAGPVRGLHVLAALVVAEKVNPVLRKARPQREMKLAGRDDVEAQPLCGDHAQELRRCECLGRVENLAGGARGRHVLGRALANRRLVIDIERSAVHASKLNQVAAAHLHVAGGVYPVSDREQQLRRSVRAGAAGAATAAAATTAATLRPPESERLAARVGEARDEHSRPRRLAGRARLGGVPLREPGQDLELLGAALAPILVDGHFMNDSKLLELERLISEWPGLVSRPAGELVAGSLVPLDHLGDAKKVVDVGSGGGLPGLPLKIVLPGLSMTLVEADQAKAAFLVRACAALGLRDVEVVARRAEDVGRDPTFRETFDVAVARALAPMPVLVELCLPLVRVGGRLLAQKTESEDMDRATRAVEIMGGKLNHVVAAPSAARSSGTVVIVDKVRPTPPAYPRRAGVPARKPL